MNAFEKRLRIKRHLARAFDSMRQARALIDAGSLDDDLELALVAAQSELLEAEKLSRA